MFRVVISVLILGAVDQHGAEAAQLGPYLGGLYGVTERHDDGAEYDRYVLDDFYPFIAFTPTIHMVALDNEGQGYGIVAGRRLHANFAIEGMFVSQGEVEYRARSAGTASLFNEQGQPQPYPLSVEAVVVSDLNALGVYALGIWPFAERWELYARGGLQVSSVRSQVRLDRTAGTERISRAEAGIARSNSVDVAAGAGVALSILQIYGLRLEYTRVFSAGSDLLARGDADMLSLGLIVAF